jgi:hypothetical protein
MLCMWPRNCTIVGAVRTITVFVDERDDGARLSYDRMVSLLAPYGNLEALNIARDPDAKVEDLFCQVAA